VYNRKRIGARIDLCGTPNSTRAGVDLEAVMGTKYHDNSYNYFATTFEKSSYNY